MALLANDAEDRSARRRQEPPRFLDGWRVHPVLRVAEPHAGGAAGADDLVRRRERALEHRQARGAGAAEEAGEGLLDDDVLARRRRFHRHRGMQMRRHAQVDHVDFGIVEDGAEVRTTAAAPASAANARARSARTAVTARRSTVTPWTCR
jgi:hypothetical protein